MQLRALVTNHGRLFQGNRVASAMSRAQMLARMVDQNAAHDLRSDAKEVGSILPLDVLIDKLQIGLIHQRGCLQGVVFALADHVTMCEAV